MPPCWSHALTLLPPPLRPQACRPLTRRPPPPLLTPQSILEGLLLWSEDSKNRFRLKTRMIVERLVRRCGLDAVTAACPEGDMRLVAHIRKQNARKERRRAGGSEAGSEVRGAAGGGGGGEGWGLAVSVFGSFGLCFRVLRVLRCSVALLHWGLRRGVPAVHALVGGISVRHRGRVCIRDGAAGTGPHTRGSLHQPTTHHGTALLCGAEAFRGRTAMRNRSG